MNNLEELKKKYEELGKEIKRLENRKRWRAEEYDDYFHVNSFGNINRIQEQNDNNDNFAYKSRDYFKTREEAEAHLDRLNTYYDLMDLAEELNNGEEINWSTPNQSKYYIYYNTVRKKLEISLICYSRYIGQIYCLDKNFLEKAIEKIRKNKT